MQSRTRHGADRVRDARREMEGVEVGMDAQRSRAA